MTKIATLLTERITHAQKIASTNPEYYTLFFANVQNQVFAGDIAKNLTVLMGRSVDTRLPDTPLVAITEYLNSLFNVANYHAYDTFSVNTYDDYWLRHMANARSRCEGMTLDQGLVAAYKEFIAFQRRVTPEEIINNGDWCIQTTLLLGYLMWLSYQHPDKPNDKLIDLHSDKQLVLFFKDLDLTWAQRLTRWQENQDTLFNRVHGLDM